MMSDFIYRPIDINQYFDKIFYINLKKDADRNEKILSQFRHFGIVNFERIEGISYNHIDQIPDAEMQYRNFIKKNDKYVINQLGCRASHLMAIQIAKSRGYNKVLILEDDITFLNNPNEILTMNHNILNDWDMLYFGGMPEPYFRNQIVLAHAYCVSSKLFDDIICMGNVSGMEIDNFYAKIIQQMSYNHNQSGKYNIRIVQPFNTIIQNKSFKSNIS